jgi:hypothetical protein
MMDLDRRARFRTPKKGRESFYMPRKAAAAMWKVSGGIIPGQARPELDRKFWYTSDDKEADRLMMTEEEKLGLDPCRPGAPLTIFQTRLAEAVAYWNTLNDPRQHSWAQLTFIWI